MREIKGPEDVQVYEAVPWPIKPGVVIPLDYVPACEVGQIIALAMDAALSECDEWSSPRGDAEAMAWRELSERLKGM